LNRTSDLGIYFLNKASQAYFGDYCEIILTQGTEAMRQIIHPASTQHIMRPLQNLASAKDPFRIYNFVQYARRNPDSDYEGFITSSRFVEPEDALISITHSVSCLDKFVRHMFRLLDQDTFYTKNYLRFMCLTKREKEILRHIAEGKSNKEISEILNISKFTVKTHRQNILRKLETNKLAELIKYAQTFL